MNVAWLGTGIMGAPMARHVLEAGHEVAVWNRTAEKARPLIEQGARAAPTPAAAVAGADVVVTMLADGAAVEAVLQEAGPAAAGATWWQASTVGIHAGERLAALADEHGLAYVDGPVLGTRGPAEQGQLVVLASGDADALARCAPLFDAVGSRTMVVGAGDEATRLKLVVNHWVIGVTDLIAETIAFAEGLGLDPRLYLQAIEGGSLDLGYAHVKGPGMIAGDLPLAFPLKHALKDAELIMEAGRRNGVELGLAPVVRERLARAAEDGYADDDMGYVIAATRPRET